MNETERKFNEHPDDAMAIFQLKTEAPAELRFMRLDSLKSPPDKANYEAVYACGIKNSGDVSQTLEDLYFIFNQKRPDDFKGHSMSVSDIVALKRGGVVSYYYCDSIGFKELPDFGRKSVLKRLEPTKNMDTKKKTRNIER